MVENTSGLYHTQLRWVKARGRGREINGDAAFRASWATFPWLVRVHLPVARRRPLSGELARGQRDRSNWHGFNTQAVRDEREEVGDVRGGDLGLLEKSAGGDHAVQLHRASTPREIEQVGGLVRMLFFEVCDPASQDGLGVKNGLSCHRPANIFKPSGRTCRQRFAREKPFPDLFRGSGSRDRQAN